MTKQTMDTQYAKDMVAGGFHPEAVKTYLESAAKDFALTGQGTRNYIAPQQWESVGQYYGRQGSKFEETHRDSLALKVRAVLEKSVKNLENPGEISMYGRAIDLSTKDLNAKDIEGFLKDHAKSLVDEDQLVKALQEVSKELRKDAPNTSVINRLALVPILSIGLLSKDGQSFADYKAGSDAFRAIQRIVADLSSPYPELKAKSQVDKDTTIAPPPPAKPVEPMPIHRPKGREIDA